MKTGTKICTMMCAALFAATAAFAENPKAPDADPVAAQFFPPELIMMNAKAIGLKDSQKLAIVADVKALQEDVEPLALRMEAARDRLIATLEKETVNEAAVLKALEDVLAIERSVKTRHITALVRIRNQLNADQRAELRSIR